MYFSGKEKRIRETDEKRVECGILAKIGAEIRDQDASFQTYVKVAFEDKVLLS